MMNKYIFTCGDVNGIGPEIVIKTFQKIYSQENSKLIFISPANVLDKALELTKATFDYSRIKHISDYKHSEHKIVFHDLKNCKLEPGKPTLASGRSSFEALEVAHKYLVIGNADSIVTAPISKTAFNLAGINFPGHTELMASWANTDQYSMMFLSNNIICTLVTIHEPIKNLSKLISKTSIRKTVDVALSTLKNDFGIKKPKIAVLGLNPHAGEEGKIGDEEIKIIKPVIDEYSDDYIHGPFVPDAFFGMKLYRNYDCIVGIYHDQILIPFKMMHFDKGVNFTAGLPFVRTSPDHGTAFDIAWQNKANPTSMIEAFRWAKKIVNKRKIIK